MPTIEQLYETLNLRKRPEDVADMIMDLAGASFTRAERSVLEKAAGGSLKRSWMAYTSMLQTFAKPIGAGKQINRAFELFQLVPGGGPSYDDPADIAGFINLISPLLRKTPGDNNFKTHRLNKTERKQKGLDISKREYNKKWRLLKRIEEKLKKLIRVKQITEFQMIGKHGLAHAISFNDFSADLASACFIAYYNARCNLRSTFTNKSQERPFDEICEMLFEKCKGKTASFLAVIRSPMPAKANWWAIAHIYSTQEVLSHLSDEQRGVILGKWTTALQRIALLLSETWLANDIQRKTMIVKRGNDSSTWNSTASAWNKARDNWMNLIYSLGMDYLLDELCFGKVLRLMAADVVAWHAASGGRLDPNTEVWNKLPLPWEVFQGKEFCNREIISHHCKEAGIDPEKSGWIAPRIHGIATFQPTPELVHGITISNPFLAAVLKRHKYFSGKNPIPLDPENN